MVGSYVLATTYVGSNDVEKDLSCCTLCSQNSACEFWVRATDSSDCWLKQGFTTEVSSTVKRGGFKVANPALLTSATVRMRINGFNFGYDTSMLTVLLTAHRWPSVVKLTPVIAMETYIVVDFEANQNLYGNTLLAAGDIIDAEVIHITAGSVKQAVPVAIVAVEDESRTPVVMVT